MKTRLAVASFLALSFALSANTGALGRAEIPNGLITSADTRSRVVALTFDDGPSPFTPLILHVLHRYHVPATFFVVGVHVPEFPEYVRDEARAGDEIGNHTYNHLDLQDLSTPQVIAQLNSNQSTIRSASGVTPHWFRPPYGDVDARIIQIARSLGLHTITWSVDPADWSLPGRQAIISNVLTYTHSGSVVIMHDGGGDRSETVAALPTIIEHLKREHFRFGTLDQLFGVTPLPACVPDAARTFSRAGIPAHPSLTIYKAWARMLCFDDDIGPATSREYGLANGQTAQDFFRTAHRLEWRPGHPVVMTIMWGWAAQVFEKHHVKPLFGRPITHAWFADFLQDQNWGPALGRVRRGGSVMTQRFARGTATQERDGRVVWTKSTKPAKKK